MPRKFLLIIILCLSGPYSQAGTLFVEDFETGVFNPGLSLTCADAVDRFSIQSNITRSGNYAAFLENMPDAGKRCELTYNGRANFNWGEERWLGFSFNIPNNNAGYGILNQHHSVPGPIGNNADWSIASGANGFTIRLSPDREEFEIRLIPPGNESLNHYASATPSNPMSGSATHATNVYHSWPVELNKWFDIVLNFRYSPASDGFFKVWVDGNKVIDITGSNVHLHDVIGRLKNKRNYLKTGIYSGTPGSGAVYYDEIRLGDETSSYADVDPARGNTRLSYEGEDLLVSGSSGDSSLIVDNIETSNGEFFLYQSNSVDDYVTFDVNVTQAGSYNIALDYWGTPSRGTLQLSIDGVDVGAVFDQYTSSNNLGTVLIGPYYFSDAGIYTFTFTNVERNPSSSADKFSIDVIKLESNMLFSNGFE